MKVYCVFNTDMWESRESEDMIGIFSTISMARKCVKSELCEDSKIIINEMIVDEVGSEVKFEVYDFESGLEYKTKSSDAEYGSLAMVLLSSSYYEVADIAVEARLIPIIIEDYMKWMDKNGQEPEIDYMETDEFLKLSDGEIDHVLYHAELYNGDSLQDFFKLLNTNHREVA